MSPWSFKRLMLGSLYHDAECYGCTSIRAPGRNGRVQEIEGRAV